MNSTKIPTDRVYDEGIPVNHKLDAETGQTLLETNIDWTQNVALGDATKEAAATAVTHFHYAQLSHVLLCEQLLQQPPSQQVEDAANVFLEEAASELIPWGKYINRLGTGGTLTPELREYYRLLFQEPDPTAVLLGIAIIDVTTDAVYEEMRAGDSVLERISNLFVEDVATKTDYAALKPVIQSCTEEEQQELVQKTAQYVDLLELIIETRADTLEQLGTSAAESRENAGKRLKQFYAEIGLTGELLA